MSATPLDTFPDDLTSSAWEKDKKSGFDAKSDLADKLKALQKKHGATEWKQFDDGWAKAAETLAELDDAFALRDRVYRSSVFALKKDVLAVASLAKTEEKKATKPLLDTLKAIGKAANTYADEIDKGLDALKRAFDKAKDNMPDDQDDEDSLPAALVNPKLLYKQLTLCRNDPERAMRFAFVDAKDKEHPALLALHPRMSGRSLFKKLQDAAGVKTGAHGSAWIDGANLMLQLDKPLSGLVKKVRVPVKASGFKVAKVILWNADGTVFEQDAEEDDGNASTPAAPGAISEAGGGDDDAQQRAYQARRDALWPRLQEALRAGPDAAASKLRAVAGFADGKAEAAQYPAAMKALDTLQGLLGPEPVPGAPAGSASQAASQAASPATSPAGITAPAAAPAPATRRPSPRVLYLQGRMGWDALRQRIRKELQSVEAKVLAETKGKPDAAEIEKNSGVLFSVLDHLDERLIDKLDDALNAADPEQRARHDAAAAAIIDEYLAFAREDTLLNDILPSGYTAMDIPALVQQQLGALARHLKQPAAA